MTLKLLNKTGFTKKMLKYVQGKEEELAKERKAIAQAFHDALITNMPVWSGRTMRSLKWSNTGAVVPKKTHPWKSGQDTTDFGDTNRMPLNTEPKFPQAKGYADASLNATNFGIKEKVYVTINSTAWDDGMNEAKAPDPHRARNHAVMVEIAKATVKAIFKDVK